MSNRVFSFLVLVVAFLCMPVITEAFSLGVLVAKGRAGGQRLKKLLRRGKNIFPADSMTQRIEIIHRRPVTMQPRPMDVERKLQEKYAAIDDLEERAFQILLDLGMIGEKF